MRLRTTSAIFGALALGLAGGAAQALPATKAPIDTTAGTSAVQKVHHHSRHRCAWRHGARRCWWLGGYRYGSGYGYGYGYGYSPYSSYGYYPYSYGPSIFFGFGGHGGHGGGHHGGGHH